ncbi:MAG: COP23 domain-containing protein [Phormidium sp.]
MKFKFSIPVLVATLALSNAAMFPTQVQAFPTTFSCNPNSNGQWVTWAQKGPMKVAFITWTTATGEYSQEERCKKVATRLTKAVTNNGGSLHDLWLSTGRVNGEAVICFLNHSKHCNKDNVLLTLVNFNNAKHPDDALVKLKLVGSTAAGAPLNEAGGGTQGGEAPVVSLEEAVDNAFAAGSVNESGSGEQSTPRQNPSNQPDPGSNTDGNNGGGPL